MPNVVPGGSGGGFFKGQVISSITQIYLERKREKFQQEQTHILQDFQKGQLEEQQEFQRVESKKSRLFNEQLENNRLSLQRELGETGFKLQIALANEARKTSRELALFTAKSQSKLSIDNAEHNYELANFPLHIRKNSLKKVQEFKDFLPMKIVVAPPTVTDGGKSFSGSDSIITAAITQLLQYSLPDDYYEFLGGAWRDDSFRAQSAYKCIYTEFYDEPFLIIDCDISRGYFLSFRICFWTPVSHSYRTIQLLDNRDIRELLQISAKKRVEKFYNDTVIPFNRLSDIPIEKLYPERTSDIVAYKREMLLKETAGEADFANIKYEFDADDYNECLRLISTLSAFISGVAVDAYQLSVGVSRTPELLKIVQNIIPNFPETKNFPLRSMMTHWVINEYESLLQEGLLDAEVDLNCKLALAEVCYQIGERSLRNKTNNFLDKSWISWCRVMGFEVIDLNNILHSNTDLEMLKNVLEEDKPLTDAFKKIYSLYQSTYKLGLNHELTQLEEKLKIQEDSR